MAKIDVTGLERFKVPADATKIPVTVMCGLTFTNGVISGIDIGDGRLSYVATKNTDVINGVETVHYSIDVTTIEPVADKALANGEAQK